MKCPANLRVLPLPAAGRSFLFGALLAWAWAWFASAPCRATAETVILWLRNGDRVSGELLSESGQRIVLRSPIVGRVKISADQIERRERPTAPKPPLSAQPSVTLPATAAQPAASLAASPGASSANRPATNLVAPTRLQRLAPAWLDPFLTNWHGNVQIGMDLGYGTTDRQTFHGNGTATHSYGRVRNTADFRASYGFVDKVQSAERIDGGWKLDVDLGQRRRLYVYDQFGAGYDKIRKLDLQYQEGVGVGYKIWQRPKLLLSGELGGQYQILDYRTASGINDRTIVSARVGEALSWSISEKLKLTQKLAIMPNIQDLGDYRARFDLGLSYPLLRKMTIHLNVVDEYDSSPPSGVDRNDLQVQSSLGLVF